MYIQVENDLTKMKKGNFIHLLPFGNIGEINFKNQLDGVSTDLVELGKISRKIGGLLLVGAVSLNRTIKRCSVFVFEFGKLISICDMNCFDERYSSSSGYKVIEFSGKKIGIIVDRDLFSPEAVSALTLCGCSGIINLLTGFSANMAVNAASFYSYVYGIDFAVCAENESFAFLSDGSRAKWNNGGDLPLSRIYLETRKKGRGKNGC